MRTSASIRKQLAGVGELKPRGTRCAEQTDVLLGEALGQEYVKRYFPPEAKQRAQKMVTNILSAMHDTIEGLDWMTPDTKKKALEKLSTFQVKIGYPDKWKDYSSVKIDRVHYFEDFVAGSRFVVADDWAQIGKPVDRGRWGMTPPTSNAYYNPLMNEIVFPGRHPAAAGLQHELHRRGELRRHRRGDRPRDLARLRRPGRAVRFHRQA